MKGSGEANPVQALKPSDAVGWLLYLNLSVDPATAGAKATGLNTADAARGSFKFFLQGNLRMKGSGEANPVQA